MSRREEYEKRAEELLAPIVELNGFELVDVEFGCGFLFISGIPLITSGTGSNAAKQDNHNYQNSSTQHKIPEII